MPAAGVEVPVGLDAVLEPVDDEEDEWEDDEEATVELAAPGLQCLLIDIRENISLINSQALRIVVIQYRAGRARDTSRSTS